MSGVSGPCGRCGFENPEGELVCQRCGTELDDAGAKQLIGEVVLGTYEIVDVLGRGGMSVVYRARHRLTDQRVALKILPPELAIHASLKTRFVDEAKALARLEHANIVRLYNFGEEGGRFVLAMEFVEGETFEKMIFQKGRVPWPVSVKVGIEVLKALEYAHDKGVVHRDIKPSNVLVRADGSATVMDFGIAKMTESSRLTATGQTMGTVRYMSPEQVRGQVVDLRSDIYSLGVALYEGLTGDTPFQGETHFDIMSKHLHDPPPSLRALVPDLPEAVERVIFKSLGKGREDRWQTAGDFRLALEQCLAGVSAEAIAPDLGVTAATPRAQTPAPVATAEAVVARPPSVGLASSLEPAIPGTIAEGRGADRHGRRSGGRTAMLVGAAAAVLVAGVAVVVIVGRGGDQVAGAASDRGETKPSGPTTGDAGFARSEEPEWRKPPTLADLRLKTDRRFTGAEQVRVLASRGVDAAHVARVYSDARKKFIDFVAAETGGTVEVHPLNLFIAPPALLCDPRIHAPEPPPKNCKKLGFHYEPQSRTLFLLDDEQLESLGIPEGAAVHLCRTTPSLHQKGCGKVILDPYFDALEKEIP
jgi:tRNA A-37 threonylcarbamoyl transferase component Bud32